MTKCKNCGAQTQAFYLDFCSAECSKDYRRKNNYRNSETYQETKAHLTEVASFVTENNSPEGERR